MEYSPLVDHIAGEGAAAWMIHDHALEVRDRGEDVILLSVGDPDFATPEPIVETAVASLREGHTHYAEATGELGLREAIAAHFTAHGGWHANADNVCVVSGAQNGLFFASMLLLRNGDEVIVPEPNYVTYEATIAASGAVRVPVATRITEGFRPDPEAIAAAITPRTRALLVTNPNNPTGVVMTNEEREAIAAIARDNDLWVICDEVYGALTFEGEHVPIAALPGMPERTVTVSSLSKSHAMTGWRSGWIIGPESLVRHAANFAMCVLYGLPGFVQRAAQVAIEQSDAITARMAEIYRRRRDLVVDRLSTAPGLGVVTPQAGMFVMVDVRATGLTGEEFAWALLREQGVSVLDATAFGPSAAGHIRVAYTLAEDRLEEACRRMAEFAASRCDGAVEACAHA